MPSLVTKPQGLSPVPAVSAWCGGMDYAIGRQAAVPLQLFAAWCEQAGQSVGGAMAHQQSNMAAGGAGCGGKRRGYLSPAAPAARVSGPPRRMAPPAGPCLPPPHLVRVQVWSPTNHPIPALTSNVGRPINALRTDVFLKLVSQGFSSQRGSRYL